MNEIIKLFDKFLRYYICGAVFFATVLYSASIFHVIKDLKISELFLIPLIPGTIIYTVHRNIINPLIEYIRRFIQRRREWLLPEAEWDGMRFRWGTDNNIEKAFKQIRTWGDHVQLLYSSGLSVVLGGLLTRFFGSRGTEYSFSRLLLIFCFSFYLLGFISDIRKQSAETKLERYLQNRKKGLCFE